MKVLVFIEQRFGNIKNSSLEALTTGFLMADKQSANVACVVVGKCADADLQRLSDHGAGTVYYADDAALSDFNCINYAAVVTQAQKTFQADTMLATATPMGRDLFPRLAAKLEAGLLTDLVELNWQGGAVTGVKPLYAGKVLATVGFKGQGLKLVTLRPNVFPAAANKASASKVEKLPFTAPANSRLKLESIVKGQGSKVDLTEATMIISGGRSLASADNFKILDECAKTINASVGASRAAVDSGYATHDMQVGQTGKTVNPNLYIACGISGSIQHMAGMRTSKVIVAINTAEDAPIFSVADYGIVADLFEAVPLLTKEFNSLLH